MGFEIINVIKKEKGLTNAQIAQMAGITLSTLDKITSGANTNPKLDTLHAICRVLGCTLNDFVDTPQDTANTSNLVKSDLKDSKISLEESNQLLEALGFIKNGGQLSDEDLEFLTHIIGLLNSRFSRRQAKPPKAKGYQYRPETYEELEAEVEAYRQRLLLEKKQAEESSPSNEVGDETA